MSTFVFPNQFYNDDKGRTLPKSRLYFYDSGTFNFAKVYSDRELTMELDNPVIADGAGRFPQIFMETDSTYRVWLKDRLDVEVLPYVDDYNPVIESEDLLTLPIVYAFDTLQDAISSDLEVGLSISTDGYYQVNDGGAAQYNVVAGGTSVDDGGSYIDMVNGNQLELINNRTVVVNQFGAVGDGLTDDTVSIQGAIDYINSTGGGVVKFLPQKYLVIKLNPSGEGSSDPDDYAIHFYGSDISLVGEAGTVLLRDESLPRYTIVRWGALPIVNGQVVYDNSHIKNIEFDGKYTINPSDNPDGMNLLWVHALKNSSITNSYLHNSSQYGLALQNGGRVNFKIKDVLVEDTLHDGIDIKNNGSNDSGCVIDSVTVRRFGRSTNLSTPYAGIDCMGLVKLSNILVEDFGDIGTVESGIRFKQGEESEDRGIGGHYSEIVNFEINGNLSGSYTANGIVSSAYGVQMVNGFIKNVGAGVRFRQENCSAVNIFVKDSNTGFQTSDSTYITNGDNCSFTSCSSSNSSIYGYRVETSGIEFNGCKSFSDFQGIDIRSGGLNTKWIGGMIDSPTDSSVVNTGTDTFIEGCTGFKTEFRAESSPALIDSVGSVSIDVNHDLPFTPEIYKCSEQLIRSQNNVTSSITTRVVGVSSTLLSSQIIISTASSVAGDTATLGVYIDGRYIPTGSF